MPRCAVPGCTDPPERQVRVKTDGRPLQTMHQAGTQLGSAPADLCATHLHEFHQLGWLVPEEEE